MKKCYYARSISLYGTQEDARNILLLGNLGFEVVDPNDPILSHNYQEIGMEAFYRVIDKCDVLAFKAHPDGNIPAGVAGEIGHARYRNIPIFEIPGSILKRILTKDETREYLKDIGAR